VVKEPRSRLTSFLCDKVNSRIRPTRPPQKRAYNSRRLWTTRTSLSMEHAYLLSTVLLNPSASHLRAQMSRLRHHTHLGRAIRVHRRLLLCLPLQPRAERTEAILHSRFPVEYATSPCFCDDIDVRTAIVGGHCIKDIRDVT